MGRPGEFLARAALLVLPWLGAWSAQCAAHEVHHAVAAAGAVTVTLSYADGKPFAYEKYELTPAGAQTPHQVGNTDAQGRVVFVPGAASDWRIKAYTADGHGVDLRFAVPATAAAAISTADSPAMSSAGGPSRASLVLFGLGLIFGAFGLFQMFLAKRRAP